MNLMKMTRKKYKTYKSDTCTPKRQAPVSLWRYQPGMWCMTHYPRVRSVHLGKLCNKYLLSEKKYFGRMCRMTANSLHHFLNQTFLADNHYNH